MRHAALSILVVSTLMLSGCVDFFTPTADDIENAEGPQDPNDQGLGQADDPTIGTDGDGTDSDGDTSGGSSPDPAAGTGEAKPDPDNESEPSGPDVAPPNEQFQESPEDLDRPGEYALLPKGNANSPAKTSAPTWPTGATWTFRTNALGNTCDQTHTVTGSDTFYDVPVYLMDTDTHNCGDRNGNDETDTPRWKADLMKIDEDGYVEHELVFPLEDGKRWRYHRHGNTTVNVSVDFVPGYLWNLKSVSAWHITLEYSGGNLRMEKWYGIDAKHYLREEVWVPAFNPASPTVETDLLSYDH